MHGTRDEIKKLENYVRSITAEAEKIAKAAQTLLINNPQNKTEITAIFYNATHILTDAKFITDKLLNDAKFIASKIPTND